MEATMNRDKGYLAAMPLGSFVQLTFTVQDIVLPDSFLLSLSIAPSSDFP